MSKVQSGRAFKLMLITAGLVVLPGLIALGLWQLDRAEEKRQLIASWNEADIALKRVPQVSELQLGHYLAVKIQGSFDAQRYFLLDNRFRLGKVGYEVIAVFVTDSNKALLVNLGWHIGDQDRSKLPVIYLPQSKQKIEGHLRLIEKAFLLSDDDLSAGEWPKVVQALDANKLASALELDLKAVELRLSKPVIEKLDIDWPVLRLKPEKHTGYAVQWFAMAFALFCLLIWGALKVKREPNYG